jgi:hypothetical protein
MPLCEHLMENYGVIDQRNILDNLLLALLNRRGPRGVGRLRSS